MKNLVFKKLMILSEQERKGIQLEFHEKVNVITGEDNSVGKSTLVKSLLWSLGCDPFFDDAWKSAEAKTLVEFSIGQTDYACARDSSRVMLAKKGEKFKVFTRVTGEYAREFASLVNFNALLPERDSKLTTAPPPAFYFLPFYIDQKRSWIDAWDSFDGLKQYARWTKDIIPYHCGAFTKEYFTFTDEIFEAERNKLDIESEIARIDTAINVVDEFIPKITTTIDTTELSEIKEELEQDLANLHSEQEILFEEIANLKSDREHQEIQLKIVEASIDESELDYDYSLEISQKTELECPTCGTTYDNTLVDRFALLQDQEQLKQVYSRISAEIRGIDNELHQRLGQLENVKYEIEKLNKKYYREDRDKTFDLSTILDSVAAHSVRYKVESTRQENVLKSSELATRQQNLRKDRSKSVKERKKEVYEKFNEVFPSLVNKLGAEGIKVSQITSPMTHKKVAISGGAAEGTRGLLAYYLAIVKLSHLFGESANAPFIIDTPKQQEQADVSYEEIVSSLIDDIPDATQIFICGMNDKALSPLKELGKTFFLEGKRSLLKTNEYEKVKGLIAHAFSN